MAGIKETAANLLEYVGIRSRNYYHSETKPSYDPDDLMAYYLDQSHRADYDGPYDRQGVPLYSFRGEEFYLPVMIGFYALGHLERFRQRGSERQRDTFLRVTDWFVTDQEDDGTWRSEVPMPRFNLPPRIPSAMVQGVAMSCLVRANLLTENTAYLDAALRALKPFHLDVSEGGVTSHELGRPFYEEYPAEPSHHVFNGFLYAMWGLYDLVRLNGNAEAKRLFDDGLATFVEWLPLFDTGYWSLYHISEGLRNPATIHYHRLHLDQLDVLHALTGEQIFEDYRQRWQGYLDGRFNALRTLPAKILWRLIPDPSFFHSKGPGGF